MPRILLCCVLGLTSSSKDKMYFKDQLISKLNRQIAARQADIDGKSAEIKTLSNTLESARASAVSNQEEKDTHIQRKLCVDFMVSGRYVCVRVC